VCASARCLGARPPLARAAHKVPPPWFCSRGLPRSAPGSHGRPHACVNAIAAMRSSHRRSPAPCAATPVRHAAMTSTPSAVIDLRSVSNRLCRAHWGRPPACTAHTGPTTLPLPSRSTHSAACTTGQQPFGLATAEEGPGATMPCFQCLVHP
jgi:hypothetical protein